MEGGNMEREGFECPCPERASACETGTDRRQRTRVWGRGAGTVSFFLPTPGDVFALDFDFVVGRLLLSFFFGVEVFNGIPPFCFSAKMSMSRVSLNGGRGFSREDARGTRTKLPSESGVVFIGEEEGKELGEDKGVSKIRA
jgi:hypothetical protein